MNPEIIYVKHGIGNRFKDSIELNEGLLKYPRLHKQILNHELKHTDKIFTKGDLMLDLSDDKVDKRELFKFMWNNPKSLSQFLPFYWTKKHGFVYDINLIVFYAIILVVIGVSLFVSFSI